MSWQSSDPIDANITREESLKVWNCINCRRRKVRCDRRHPCAPCTRNKTECVFPVSGRIPRRSRDGNYHKVPAQKRAELLGRLRRLEALVGDLGTQVENVTEGNPSDLSVDDGVSSVSNVTRTSGEPSPLDRGLALSNKLTSKSPDAAHGGIQTGHSIAESTSQSLQTSNEHEALHIASNGDLVVGNRFWTVFCKEVEDIFEAVHGSTVMHFDEENSSSTMSTPGSQRHTGYYNFLLRNVSAAGQREELYPPPSQMLFLWQIYIDNIDPFMKVLHIPTMTEIIRGLRGSYDSLDLSTRALVLVISLAAIISLKDEEVQIHFSSSKDQLVARYRLGTEGALEQADFMNKPDLTVLKALTIYLGLLQHTGEAKAAWLLTGVLIRVAVCMNLHRDGLFIAKVASFEMEMRRRLWWQICFIDSQTANGQVRKFKLSERMFDTMMPSNIDDADLDPADLEMPKRPIIVEKWTDMTFSFIRCEIWKLSRNLSREFQSITAPSYAIPLIVNEKRKSFQQSKAWYENAYLKHLDPVQPLQSFVAASTRLYFTKVELILYIKQYPTNMTDSQPDVIPQSKEAFGLSLPIIEYTYALQNEIKWSGYTWQLQGRQPPWYALRIVLNHLYTHHQEPLREQAWSSAKKTLDSIPKETESDPRYQQLSNLASAIQRRRADELEQKPGPLTNATDPISAMFSTSASSAPLTQVNTSETASTSTPQESLPYTTNEGNNSLFNDGLDLDFNMDWEQVWDDMSGDFFETPS